MHSYLPPSYLLYKLKSPDQKGQAVRCYNWYCPCYNSICEAECGTGHIEYYYDCGYKVGAGIVQHAEDLEYRRTDTQNSCYVDGRGYYIFLHCIIRLEK